MVARFLRDRSPYRGGNYNVRTRQLVRAAAKGAVWTTTATQSRDQAIHSITWRYWGPSNTLRRASQIVSSYSRYSQDHSIERPHQIVMDLPDGFALRRPLPLTLWREGAEFVADSEELNLHAFGQTREAAISSLKQEIVSHYRFLEGLAGRISPAAQEEAARYRDWIKAPDA